MADAASAARYLAVREALGLSQGKLGHALGNLQKQTVSSWERGVSDPHLETVRKLSEMARMAGHPQFTVEYLLSGEVNETATNVVGYQGRGRQVAILGDTTTKRNTTKRRPSEFVQTHFECSNRSYALRVVGESMADEFLPGDVVIIDPALKPVPGDFVFVEMEDGTALFRKYRPQKVDGKSPDFDLVPINEDWPTVHVSHANPGKIRGVMSERITPRRRTS